MKDYPLLDPRDAGYEQHAKKEEDDAYMRFGRAAIKAAEKFTKDAAKKDKK